jgi:hypothetical protein
LVLDEHGFGHHRAGTAGTSESGNGRQQMQKQDGQIAHRRILPRSRHGQRLLTNFGIRHAHGVNRDWRGADRGLEAAVRGRLVCNSPGANVFLYASAPDGSRFLVDRLAPDVQPTLEIILNWGRSDQR